MSVKANATITLIRVNDGTNGKDGTSVKITSKSVTYQASTSGTTTPTGTWVANPPAVAKGQYLWTKTVVTYSDGNSTTAYSVAYQGTNGTNGQNGSAGRGVKSTEVTYQIWDNGTSTPNGTWQPTVPDTTSDKPYLWTRTVITYTDNTKSTSYSVGSTLKGVNVGGRNLIRYGKGDSKNGIFKNFTSMGDDYGEVTLKSKRNFPSISLKDGFVLGCRDYKVGAVYIWSYDIMYTDWNFPSGTDRSELWMGQRYTSAPSGETSAGNWRPVTQHDLPVVGVNGCKLNEWYHVEKTVVISEQASSNVGDTASIQFYNSNANVEASFTARFRNIKLELGNIATDWTPAPEDVDEGINNANTNANNANANASAAKKDAANANSSAQQAGDIANTAKADAAAANSAIQTALKQIAEIQTNSNEAKKLASDAWNGVSPIAQVVKADTQGLKILNSKDSTNYAQMQDVGLFIFVSNNQVAEFGINSKMRNIAIQDYLMFGSHRAETTIIKEEESTAFYWIGDVK